MKRSFVASLCLVAVLLVLCICPLEAGRHRNRSHRKSKRDTGVHIEIYHPKGVMIWYPQRPGMVAFGIEIYLNKKHMVDDEPVCDICMNTTEVSYGKFILRNDNAVVRGGDHLMYNAIKQKVNGSAYVMKSNEFYVADSRIINTPTECSPNIRSQSEDKPSNVQTLKEDISLLENIVYNTYQHCNNITRTSKKLFLNFRPTETRLDSKELFKYTLSSLKDVLPKMDWDNVLVDAFYYDDGIGFEVKSLIDKLKALQMARNFVQLTVNDLDEFNDSSDDDNEIDTYTMRYD
ncbi:uncharacterized protein LOC129777160 [Toxorhynchites rutilus septentrionalis]|uniref:uncharacterized protein LOC129777160 n=1 Tax=Toxorhynchites rutilus septentrionalis TaxID=329112 RepID=UPI00247B0D58|nr:uncharacterized protein LOC129777160 [Toxorhynchites rutilus septentrionalis]